MIVQVLDPQVQEELDRRKAAETGHETRPPAWARCVVAVLRCEQDTGRVLPLCCSIWNLPPNLQHLKRISKQNSKVRALFCPARLFKLEDLDTPLGEFLASGAEHATEECKRLAALLCGEDQSILARQVIQLVDLPESSPSSHIEARQWSSRIWPVIFHPRFTLSAKSHFVVSELSAEETSRSERWLAELSEHSARNGGAPACLIVEPKTNTLVATGVDKCTESRHPLRHAVMVAIEDASDKIIRARKAFGLTVPRENLESSEETKRRKLDASAGIAQNVGVGAFFDPVNTYLCTGFELYSTQEPCAMCAMGVLHSRFLRVFYANSNPRRGALGSILSLHCNAQFNHHFAVYKPK